MIAKDARKAVDAVGPRLSDRDVALETAIRNAWSLSGDAQIRRLACRAAEGLIILDGEVSSYYRKQRAQEIARATSRGCEILNRVVVSDEAVSGLTAPTRTAVNAP
ncbi:MAG: hypothetical protein K1X74_02130 [Pirellulales bacterium]|nr:hypothetical protein [Pirellulales bacterium]